MPYHRLSILAIAALLAGCASAVYSPPSEGRRIAEQCPFNMVKVCEDRYPSRLEGERKPEPMCMCRSLGRVR